MMGRYATAVLVPLLTLAFLAPTLAWTAQQEAGNDAKSDEKKEALPYAVRVRLPNYFGQIGLSREQRRELREVCEQFDRKIAELRWKIQQMEEEIRKLREEKLKACLEKLTEDQRKRWEELREAAKRRRSAAGDQR